MLVLAFLYVGEFGRNVPVWDDWDMVDVVLGEEPLTLEWLWKQHNEHRIPLPKLLYVLLLRAGNYDLRVIMLFNVILLGTASAALLVALRRRRGETKLADVLIPLALLHVGQVSSLLWTFQISFVTGTALVASVLILLLGIEHGVWQRWRYWTLALCIIVLPFCGANTLAFVPPLAVWLAYVGYLQRRQGGVALIGAALGSLLLVGLWFVGWKPGPAMPPATPWMKARTALQFLSTATGPALRSSWWVSAAVVAPLAAGTGLYLVGVWWRAPRADPRSIGLACLLAGMAALAAGTAWGRASLPDNPGLANRYITLTAPLLCALYVAWELYVPRGDGGGLQLALATLMALLLVPNTLQGIDRGRVLYRQRRDVEELIQAAAAPAEVVAQSEETLWAYRLRPELIVRLELLRNRKLGPYAPPRSNQE
jgi:hypothetical protein